MPKLFRHRVTNVGKEALSEAFEASAKEMQRSEATYGADSMETANCARMLGFIHYRGEAYKDAEPMFERYLATAKKLRGIESIEYYEECSQLRATYFGSSNFTKLSAVGDELILAREKLEENTGREGAIDPLVASLYDLALAHNAQGDAAGRRVAFVLVLVALSHCVTRYREGGEPRKEAMQRLRSFVMSLGIDKYDCAWLVRCSDHEENDFVGLLSVIDEEGVFPLRHG